MKVCEQILCNIGDAAKLLGIGKSKFYSMLSASMIGPKTILLAGKKMFLVSELKNWAAANCPNRENWALIKGQNNGT